MCTGRGKRGQPVTGSSGLLFGFKRRHRTILQTETAECGLACLAMIAEYHGCSTDLASLRRRFLVSAKGARLTSLISIAERLHLGCRAVRAELDALEHLTLPCILHWNFQHYVVLRAVGAKSITISDPAKGERRVPMVEVSRSFTGVALELWPDPEFKAQEKGESIGVRDLAGQVTGLRRSLGQILVFALVLEVLAITSPFFMQWVIDNVLLSRDIGLLAMLALAFGLLMVVQQLIGFVRSWALISLGATANVQWRANVFAHMLRLPAAYFERRHLGDIVSRFSSIDTIQRTLTVSFVESLLDGLMSLLTMVVLFVYSPPLAWVCVGVMSIYGFGRWVWYRPLRDATAAHIVHAARQQSHFLETIRGVRTIKLFQRHEERRLSWLTLLADQMNADVKTQKLQMAWQLLNGLLFGLQQVLVIWLGAKLVMNGQFSVGMLTAFLAYRMQFATRVAAFIDKCIQLTMLRLHGERLADIVLSAPESDRTMTRLMLEAHSLEPNIEVRHLKFRYADHEPWVLKEVNIQVGAGESVAITGPSGCGKTTLMNVMLGVLQPTEGEVLIGGVDIRSLGVDALRSMSASVTQDDTLFEGSIADNICFFDAEADQSWIEACARRAAIHEDIVTMPMGYNTFIGHLGSALSGGQKQRILLARALYKRPQILFLDEATSHLDVRREQAVSSAVRSLRMTRVVIAHRPQTIRTTDRVIRMKDGTVVDTRLIGPVEVVGENVRLASD